MSRASDGFVRGSLYFRLANAGFGTAGGSQSMFASDAVYGVFTDMTGACDGSN